MNLLIVDDDPSITMLLSLVLTAEGHRVTVFNSTKEFNDNLTENVGFDGVILDFLLPGTDTFVFKTDICKKYSLRPDQIIFLTASPEHVDDSHLCISKPFSPKTISAEICDILIQSKKAQRNDE